MTISKDKRRYTYSLTPGNVDWLNAWLKRNHAPKVLLTQMIEEYLSGMRYTIEEMEKVKGTPTIGDFFRITGDTLDRLKESKLN
jgi:hypothetical protein